MDGKLCGLYDVTICPELVRSAYFTDVVLGGVITILPLAADPGGCCFEAAGDGAPLPLGVVKLSTADNPLRVVALPTSFLISLVPLPGVVLALLSVVARLGAGEGVT